MPKQKKLEKFIVRKISKYDWSELEELCGQEKISLLQHFAGEVKKVFGKDKVKVWTFSATVAGGGVADLLDALTSLSLKQDIEWKWFVIRGNEDFFRATKLFHNALHASSAIKTTEKTLKDYMGGINLNISALENLVKNEKAPDIILVHDPQPLALFPEFKKKYPVLFKKYFKNTVFIWQSHIPFNISEKSRLAKFLIKYINFYDLAVYHRNNNTPGLKIPIFNQNTNSINPLDYYNIDLAAFKSGQEFIDATIAKHGIRRYGAKTRFAVQIARFDYWKDPLGVIEAFEEAFEILKKKKKQIKLILVGPIASDDIEEAADLLGRLKKSADKFNSRHKGKFIYIKPLFTKNENLAPDQWEKFLRAGFNPDRLFPRLNRFQRRALRKMGIILKDLKEYHIHTLEINAFQYFSYIRVLKSLEEGQGLSAIAAKFRNRPLIASAVGGLVGQIEDHVNGILVGLDPETKKPVKEFEKFRKLTIDQTGDAIVELVENPELAKALGQAGRLDVLENYTTLRQLRAYYQIFIEAKRRKEKN